MVKLLFTRQRTLASFLIRLVTWSSYSHVDVIVDGLLYGSRAFHGVKYEGIDERLKSASSSVIMEIDYDGFDFHSAKKFAELNIGKKYDWLGAIGIWLKLDIGSNKRWFCSELVAEYLKAGGLSLYDKKYYKRITPQNLFFLNYKKVSVDV